MKNAAAILLLMSLIPLVWAQPMPSGGTIIAGEVTYLGERIDSAKITIEVPNTGYKKSIHSTFSHKDMNYYLLGVTASKGDYIIVTVTYKDQKTTDYILRGDEDSYILNIELTDEPRLPPDATTTLAETTPATSTSLTETTIEADGESEDNSLLIIAIAVFVLTATALYLIRRLK